MLNKKTKTRLICSGTILPLLFVMGVLTSFVHAGDRVNFKGIEKLQTHESLEPDVWGAIWLLSILNNGKANILVESFPKDRHEYTSFGFQGADIYLPNGSYFNYFLGLSARVDPVLHELGVLVSSVENIAWRTGDSLDVSRFEADFRAMQEKFGRYWVPLGCYKSFFDKEYAKLADVEYIHAADDCHLDKFTISVSRASIPTTAIEHVLFEIESGKNVVFLDTREPSEYEERHIPGAISLPFRDIDTVDGSLLAEADMVIPYCIKDFRGFEAARRLQENGIEHVTLLDPFGLAGWVKKDLPLAGTEALTESEGLELLSQCVATRCLNEDKAAL